MSEKQDKENFFCCEDLVWDIDSRFSPVHYSTKWREYSISNFESVSTTYMKFCYHCGAELPGSLRDKWFDLLEQEYGIKATLATPWHEIPNDFRSDEWWRQRGL